MSETSGLPINLPTLMALIRTEIPSVRLHEGSTTDTDPDEFIELRKKIIIAVRNANCAN